MTRFVLADAVRRDGALAVVVFQSDKRPSWSRPASRYPSEILKIAAEDGFQAKTGGSFIVRPPKGLPAARLLLLSAGKPADAVLHTLRTLAGTAARRAADAGIGSLTFLVPDELSPAPEAVQAVVEGFLLGSYRFEKHKSRPSASKFPGEVRLVAKGSRSALETAIRRGEAFAASVNFARDLINEPPSLKTPEVLAGVVRRAARGPLRAKVYRKSDLKRMKMQALLGVNRGSAHPPVLVHLAYKPAGRPRKRIAIVGKGITFDSGGLSLKTADGMMTMKYDMAGAASVFGVIKAVAALRAPVEVHAVAPITENMPGHDAYKPGDVVRAANGKTIEVLNTDAEGRVVLADALSYASKLPVDEILDMATLTGAVTVALGKAYAALMANDDAFADRLRKAAERAGEKVWRLPLEPSYREHIRSKVADLKNIGNPGEAGTIIGGLFLQEFVGGKPWVHLDIAGAGWSPNGSALGAPGATGVMIRTLLHYLMD